ncbi:hypothetical protein N658DRAFT_346984 [Parathielavia hyrcaniae]|uniref:Uncharacterized protein n=1 Tax=Parathielavia hyrcaniae TaxID=113614 RepID=A0AAN6PW18_9PEZI|nr:hypothetical protein N658DRAFT_346984 [Parathielavia hyrcaniae]
MESSLKVEEGHEMMRERLCSIPASHMRTRVTSLNFRSRDFVGWFARWRGRGGGAQCGMKLFCTERVVSWTATLNVSRRAFLRLPATKVACGDNGQPSHLTALRANGPTNETTYESKMEASLSMARTQSTPRLSDKKNSLFLTFGPCSTTLMALGADSRQCSSPLSGPPGCTSHGCAQFAAQSPPGPP